MYIVTRYNHDSWLRYQTQNFLLLDTKVYKSESFNRESTGYPNTNYKKKETFEYLNFHPQVPRGAICLTFFRYTVWQGLCKLAVSFLSKC